MTALGIPVTLRYCPPYSHADSDAHPDAADANKQLSGRNRLAAASGQ